MSALVYRRSQYGERVVPGTSKVPAPKAPPQADLTVHFRPYALNDTNFILHTWASSYRKCGLDGECQMDAQTYNVEIRARMKRLMSRSSVIVGSDSEDKDLIRCYAVYEKPEHDTQLPVLHYMLVRPEVQHRGLGRRMIELVRESSFVNDSLIYASHWTHAIKAIHTKYGIIRNNFCCEVYYGPST
jgi:hypothetical protein